MARYLRIDPMASGSNPPSAKLSFRVGELSALSNSRRRNHECGHIERKNLDTAR